jgi:hypothetical protein
MKVGMEKYRQQYPHADIVLFEPDREDADMFFANIFSYAQRKRLCAAAFQKTRRNLAARAALLAPRLARHGIAIDRRRLADRTRMVADAVTDARPLHANYPAGVTMSQAARDLGHTLDQLESWLAGAR